MRSSRQSGFSLIEIMVVIVIMGLLAGLVGPRLFGNIDKARQGTVKSNFANFKTALDSYKLDNYRYPNTEQGLDALVYQPDADPVPKKWRQYMDKIPPDPWQNEYIYEAPADNGREFDVISLGADGVRGGEGVDADISYWDEDTAQE